MTLRETVSSKLRGHAIILCFALLVGGLLRVAGLSETSPILWDDAYMFLETRFFASLVDSIADSVGRKVEEERTGEDLWKFQREISRIRHSTQGQVPFYGRPVHNAVLGVGRVLVGDLPFAGAVGTCLFSWLTIPAVYFLGRRLGGPTGGTVSAVCLAVSAYHIQYSRQTFSDADSIFFFTLCLLAYLRSREAIDRDPLRGAGLAGLLGGITFLCHPRFAFLAPLFLAFELHVLARSPLTARDFGRRLMQMGLYALVPVVAAEAPYYAVILLNRGFQEPIAVTTYFEQVLYQFGLGAAAGFTTENVLTYPYLMSLRQGVVFLLVLPWATVRCFKRRGLARLVPLACFLWPLTLFSFARLAQMRYGMLIVFGACVVMGVGLGDFRIANLRRKPRCLTATVVLIVSLGLGEMIVRSVEVVRTRYSYGPAIAWMREHAGPKHLSTQAFVSQVFVGSGNGVFVPKTEAAAAQLVQEGCRYLLTDVGLDAMRYSPDLKEEFRVAQALLANRRPVMTFPNPRGRFLQSKFEMNIRFRGSLEFIRTASERGSDEIRIYDLADDRLLMGYH